MTTTDIATLADPSGIASPGYPVQSVLRRKVIPEFFDKVGQVGWRRMSQGVTTQFNERGIDISPSFKIIRGVWAPGRRLKFIGDSEFLMDQALQAPVSTPPASYWLEFNFAGEYNNNQVDGPVGVRRIVLGAPADGNYNLTVYGWRSPYFEDDVAVVDMNYFVPDQFQWGGLVMGLRAEIYADRAGINDPTAQLAMTQFQDAIARAQNLREVTIEETPRYG